MFKLVLFKLDNVEAAVLREALHNSARGEAFFSSSINGSWGSGVGVLAACSSLGLGTAEEDRLAWPSS